MRALRWLDAIRPWAFNLRDSSLIHSVLSDCLYLLLNGLQRFLMLFDLFGRLRFGHRVNPNIPNHIVVFSVILNVLQYAHRVIAWVVRHIH